MMRFSQRASILTLAVSGLVFTSVACEKMEADASQADRRVRESVRTAADTRRTPTTQALNQAIVELTKAAGESAASPGAKIEAKSTLAQAQFEAGDRIVRDLARLEPTINRALWDVSHTADQIQRLNGTMKSLAAATPEATLKALADRRTEMTAAGEAAGKKATELQSEIDKIKGQVAALVQQKDAAIAEADAAADKASKSSDKDAQPLLETANETRRKGGNLGHEIDKQSAPLLPLERDLAIAQQQQKSAQEGVAALDERQKMIEANWQATQAQMQQVKGMASKFGEELAARAKTLDDLTKQGADLRAKAADQFQKAIANNAAASAEAKTLGTELGTWGNDQRFSKAPEKKAWDQLRQTYHLNVFKLLEAEAYNALGDLYAGQAAQLEARQKLAASISKTLQEAGVTAPPTLADNGELAKATQAAGNAYTEAAKRFVDVYEGSGTPTDVKQAAKISRIFSLYGQYLNGDKGKLSEAKAAVKEAFNDPKTDPMVATFPAELRA